MQAVTHANDEQGFFWESDLDNSAHATLEEAEAHENKLVGESIRKIVDAHVRAAANFALRDILFQLNKELADPFAEIDGVKRSQDVLIAELAGRYEAPISETTSEWLVNYLPD